MLPEEQELNRLESEQATLEDQVATAELTLETLKVETAQFQHHYYQIVGRLYVELDRLVAQIARARSRTRPGQCRSASTGRSRRTTGAKIRRRSRCCRETTATAAGNNPGIKASLPAGGQTDAPGSCHHRCRTRTPYRD